MKREDEKSGGVSPAGFGQRERDSLLQSRMRDLAERARREGIALTAFLTPAEQTAARKTLAGSGLEITAMGGVPEAERCRLALYTDWVSQEELEADRHLCAVRFSYWREDRLGHRDILGALMALGIKRETVGEIIAPGPPPAFLIAMPSIAPFLCAEFQKAGRVVLHPEIVKLEEVESPEKKVKTLSATVASLRLDAVVSESYRLSRAKAADAIRAGKVSLNWEECENPSKEVREGDVLTLRGEGRAKLKEVGGNSRKGRIRIVIERPQ